MPPAPEDLSGENSLPMRKLLFIIFSIVALTFCIDRITDDKGGVSREDVIKGIVNRANRKYCNCDMGQVPYIDIMQRDKNSDSIGYVAFTYSDITDFTIECYADSIRNKYTCHLNIYQIAKRDKADSIKRCKDGYILSGDLRTANGVTVQGYNYYRKFICRNGRWTVYSLNYKYNDKDSLQRLFNLVDNFSIATI